MLSDGHIVPETVVLETQSSLAEGLAGPALLRKTMSTKQHISGRS